MATGDMAAAMSTRVLEVYEGRDVVQSAIELPGAAGGLRRALEIDPILWRQGERAFLLFEVDTKKIRYEPITIEKEDTGKNRRVHIFGVEAATVVDEEFARDHINAMREKIRLAEEDAAGITRIPFGDEPEASGPEPGSLAAEAADMAERYTGDDTDEELPTDLDLAEPGFYCDPCDRTFQNLAGLTSHTRSAHPSVDESDLTGGADLAERDLPDFGSDADGFADPLVER